MQTAADAGQKLEILILAAPQLHAITQQSYKIR